MSGFRFPQPTQTTIDNAAKTNEAIAVFICDSIVLRFAVNGISLLTPKNGSYCPRSSGLASMAKNFHLE